jgi:hypothetical protein
MARAVPDAGSLRVRATIPANPSWQILFKLELGGFVVLKDRRRILIAVTVWCVVAQTANAAAENLLRLTPHITSCRIGFDGNFKVGHWTPLHITIRAGVVKSRPKYTVEVEAPDSDGVRTTVTSPELTADDPYLLHTMYVKLGKQMGSVHVRLLENGEVVDARVILPGKAAAGEPTVRSLPASSELIVAVAPSSFGLSEAVANRPASAGIAGRQVVELDSIADLPDQWFGYEAVDVLVLSIGDGSLWRALAVDDRRLSALREWIETGGKLVVLFGGKAGEHLVQKESTLAPFIPGRFDGQSSIGRLPETSAIEHFAESDALIVGRGERSELGVVQVSEPEGAVELYARGISQAPLVIRAPRGLGELTFVGLDMDAPPLNTWPGRSGLLRAIMKPLITGDQSHSASRSLITSGYDDLSGALRQRLAQTFPGVDPVSFQKVVGLSLLYVLVLGPLQFVSIRGWLKKSWVAWISFPLVLMLFGAGAVVFANARDVNRRPRVNSAEIIDVDVSAGRARGTYWAALYSPSSQRYDVSFSPTYSDAAAAESNAIFSWNGLAGFGIGGMDARGPDFGPISAAYQMNDFRKLTGVPLLTSGTKSFTARWFSPAGPSIETALRDDKGLLAGRIVNHSGLNLQNARILYRSWAYRLRDIEPNGERTLNAETIPISVKTLLTGFAVGEPAGSTLGPEQSALSADQAPPDQLLNVMMFFDAAGGSGFAGLPFGHQSHTDLSRHLALGRAVLVAEVANSKSELKLGDASNPLGLDVDYMPHTIYRFVLPVTRPSD